MAQPTNDDVPVVPSWRRFHGLVALALCACASVRPPPQPSTPAFASAKPGAVDAAALEKLLARARESGSDAVVVVRDGQLVGEWLFDQKPGPIETMSVTKSIVALAMARLVDTGKLASLDEPVSRFYPEWKQGRKGAITVRQLMNHTSGLQCERTTKNEIYPAPDLVQLALAAELSDDPGRRFFYNNKAVNLLAGIVQKITGQRLDEYVAQEIFTPLGILEFTWERDKQGNPHAMAGLALRPIDLARIGQLMLDEGRWNGNQVLSPETVRALTRPGQPMNPGCGLLWWLSHEGKEALIDDEVIGEWRRGGVKEDFLAKVAPLKDRHIPGKDFFAELEKVFGGKEGLETWYDNTWRRGLSDGKVLPTGALTAFNANGWLGQYLVVVPKTRLVAVRMRRAPEVVDESKIDDFKDFGELVQKLVAK